MQCGAQAHLVRKQAKDLRLRVTLIAVTFAISCVASAQLTLSEAEKLARTTNPIMIAAQRDVDAARAGARKLSAPFKAQLSLQGFGLTANGRPGDIPMGLPDMSLRFGSGLFGTGGTLKWLLYSGGRDRTSVGLGQRQIQMGELRFANTWVDLQAEVRMEFSEALKAQETIDGLAASLDAAKEIERVTRERFEAGKVPEAFVFGAEADRLRVEQELAEAQAEFDGALARLLVCCGIEVIEGRLGGWDVLLDVPKDRDAALDLAYKSSPRMAELKSEAESWRLSERLARQSWRPEISMFATSDGMWYRQQVMNSGSAIGLMLSVPVRDGGARNAEAEEAKRKAEQYDALAATERNKIRAEITAAWAQWTAAPKALAAAEGRISAASEAYRISKLRYEEGKAIRTEVSLALADSQSAKIGLAAAKSYQQQAWTKLMRAIGISTLPNSVPQ